MQGAGLPALLVHIHSQAGVEIQELKGALLLWNEEPALVGTVPAVELLDAGVALAADAVHLQALAARNIEDAVGSVAYRLECPQLVGRLTHLPAARQYVWQAIA